MSKQPVLTHAVSVRTLKGEDIYGVKLVTLPGGEPAGIFVVCDGHGGPGAAKFTVDVLLKVLQDALPRNLPDIKNRGEVNSHARNLRAIIAELCANIDAEWAKIGDKSGSTVTLGVVTGWMLTVANIGDSVGVLDLGNSFVEVTYSHRLQSNPAEVRRLQAGGLDVAPLGYHLQGPARKGEMGVGPLRAWPGGLCVSRSVGDHDTSPHVKPAPHIRQYIMPSRGCRILLASDGLWDLMTPKQALHHVKMEVAGDASEKLATMCAKDKRNADDITIIMVDVMPDAQTQFPTLVLSGKGKSFTASQRPKSLNTSAGAGQQQAAYRPPQKKGGGFLCFGAGETSDDDEPPPPRPAPTPAPAASFAAGGNSNDTLAAEEPQDLQEVADLDSLIEMPECTMMSMSELSETDAFKAPPPLSTRPLGDLSMHGPHQPVPFTASPAQYAELSNAAKGAVIGDPEDGLELRESRSVPESGSGSVNTTSTEPTTP